MDDDNELETRFTYHAPNSDQVERMAKVRAACHDLAILIVYATPMCREQSLALTACEEVSMWVNAAIARREP